MESDDPAKISARIAEAAANAGEMPASTLAISQPPPKTFREVYESEFEFVWRLIRRFGVEEKDAKDGVQTVFLRFHQNFAKWETDRPVRALLGGYAWNVASEMRRRASTRYETAASDKMPEGSLAGEERMGGRIDAMRMIRTALEVLTDEERLVIVLARIEGRSMREVAEMLEGNENTLRGALNRATEKMEREISRMTRGAT